MDGDAKISFAEFELGMKSSLNAFASGKAKRPKSTTGMKLKKRNLSREMATVTPRKNGSVSLHRSASSDIKLSSKSQSRQPRPIESASTNKRKAL